MEPYDVAKIRSEFALFEKRPFLVYLDSAATSQKPKIVIDTMAQFLREEYGTVHRAVYSLAAEATSRYNEVRRQVQKFIGAREEAEVVFTRGTTDSINLLASSFGKVFIQEDDEILISETEHHSNIVPWQILCKERKAHLKVIPVDDEGRIRLDTFGEMLSPKVRLVAIAHIANATGVVHPIEKMIQLSHDMGAKVFIDAAQSVSHLSIDVQKLDVDFLAFSSHKLYGPTGVGIFYGKRKWLDQLPPYQGGGDMIRQVTFEETTFQDPPLKFEAGTPSIAEVLGLGAAISWIEKIGLKKISSWEKQLMEYATLKMQEIPGLRFLSQASERSSIITFTCKGCHPLDLGTLLDTKDVAVRTGHLCAQPALKRMGVSSAVRVSFAAYNTLEEIDRFIIALKETIFLLKSS